MNNINLKTLCALVITGSMCTGTVKSPDVSTIHSTHSNTSWHADRQSAVAQPPAPVIARHEHTGFTYNEAHAARIQARKQARELHGTLNVSASTNDSLHTGMNASQDRDAASREVSNVREAQDPLQDAAPGSNNDIANTSATEPSRLENRPQNQDSNQFPAGNINQTYRSNASYEEDTVTPLSVAQYATMISKYVDVSNFISSTPALWFTKNLQLNGVNINTGILCQALHTNSTLPVQCAGYSVSIHTNKFCSTNTWYAYCKTLVNTLHYSHYDKYNNHFGLEYTNKYSKECFAPYYAAFFNNWKVGFSTNKMNPLDAQATNNLSLSNVQHVGNLLQSVGITNISGLETYIANNSTLFSGITASFLRTEFMKITGSLGFSIGNAAATASCEYSPGGHIKYGVSINPVLRTAIMGSFMWSPTR